MSAYNENGASFVNSPNALPKQMTKFLNAYDKLPFDNISLSDLGDILASDKNDKRSIDRDVARLVIEEQLIRLAGQVENIMISGGNQYALKYADHVVDVPTSADKFFIIDQEIPFYEMVIRGCVGYAGTAVNIDNVFDEQEQILKMIEYGTAPHFALSYVKTAEFENTVLEDCFTTNYADWMDTIEHFYNVSSELHAKIYNAKIVDHIIHDNGVREMKYDNGVTVYVNYAEEPLTAGSVTVNAKNYEIRG